MKDMKRILIVDDEKNLLALVAVHLQMAGYEPLFAQNGEEALILAKEERPDLVILDLMLPKMNGWEVCQHLRAQVETKDIPVFILSARQEVEDKLKSFESGADDYLTKPFSPRELVARVKRVLEWDVILRGA